MGVTQSIPISTESAVTALAVVGAIGFGVSHFTNSPTQTAAAKDKESSTQPVTGKNKKKARSVVASSPEHSEPEPKPAQTEQKSSAKSKQKASPLPPNETSFPGQFEPEIGPVAALTATKKPKKRKTKAKSASAAPKDAPSPVPQPPPTSESDGEPSVPLPKAKKPQKKQLQQSGTLTVDTDDGSWTRVEPRKVSQSHSDVAVTTSDAGVTTSQTGESTASSPIDESSPPLVKRIRPLPGEKPHEGYSWGDYEDVRISDDTGATFGDDDDEAGWGVVKSRSRAKQSSKTNPSKTPETLTKKQRQNAQKRAAKKEAVALAEADRVARLARHRTEREEEVISKAYGVGKSKNVGGGMNATVDSSGRLVWE